MGGGEGAGQTYAIVLAATRMRLVSSDAFSTRRSALALSAWSLVALTSRPAAHARVDGIPLYAPGDQIKLPTMGFEYWLPRCEQLRDVEIPAVRAAVTAADWPTAARLVSADAVDVQLKVFGSTASILGDEAYTALALKARYAKGTKALLALVGADAPPTQQAALDVTKELETCVGELVALIPPPVVEQVRDIERKKAALAAAAAPPPPPLPPPPSGELSAAGN